MENDYFGNIRKFIGTASCKDPNNMIEYDINCINLKAKHKKLKVKHKKLKGYMKNNRKIKK